MIFIVQNVLVEDDPNSFVVTVNMMVNVDMKSYIAS